MPDTKELEALLEKVEAASGADREIDLAICLALDYVDSIGSEDKPSNLRPSIDDPGWLDYEVVENGRLVDCTDVAAPLTASVDAALALVERMLPGWRLSLDQMQKGWDVDLSEPGNRSGVFYVAAASLPLSILAALLRALIAQEAE